MCYEKLCLSLCHSAGRIRSENHADTDKTIKQLSNFIPLPKANGDATLMEYLDQKEVRTFAFGKSNNHGNFQRHQR